LNSGYPVSCSSCNTVVTLTYPRGMPIYMINRTGELETAIAQSAGYRIVPKLQVRPYIGKSVNVFIIGQDPTLSTRQASCVLELDQEDSPIRKYIEESILHPLGFTVDDVYATNAVKCTFPSMKTPSCWAKEKRIPVERFLSIPFFRNCRRYLTKELVNVKPRIVFALGQPTHRLLVSAYRWKIKLDMIDVFGQVFKIRNPVSTLYVPVIHYNSRGLKHYREHWHELYKNVMEHIVDLHTEVYNEFTDKKS
jgi:uracil-DNA glycosylase family 4